MRISVSKSINIGPMKITLSKSGVSVSFGNSLARVGVNSQGQASVSAGVPGVKGLRFTRKKKVL